ncbi:hypothetical protein L3Q82_024404, partial [Scortum barcoo]
FFSLQEMNVSSANMTVVVEYRDSFTKAVTKNVIVVVLGLSINYINTALIQTFRKHQIFYMNPRYILFFHLVVNDMIQVTLTVILFIISYTLYKINVSICCIFILIALLTTENTPLNLACMAVECYIAICVPLRHIQICTIKRTLMLIGLIWATSMLSVLPDLFITLATEPLDFFHSRVFCLRETAFRNPHIIKKRDITYIVYLVLVWSLLPVMVAMAVTPNPVVDTGSKGCRQRLKKESYRAMLACGTPDAVDGIPAVQTKASRSPDCPGGKNFGSGRSSDLQHVLERFAAECEAAGMRISTSKSEAMVSRPEKGGVPSTVGWRGWLGRSLRDKVRSSVTREELGVEEPLLLHIERSQLRWLGHLFRMPPGRLPREVFQACPTSGGGPGEDPGHAGGTMSLSWPGNASGSPPEELEEVSGGCKALCQEMNVSSANVTVVLQYRDSFTKAVTKNMIVVVLGISINYINAALIHTFSKHQIFYMNPRYILFIHLVINDMIQVTLSIILFLISYTVYKINVSICCIFILIALLTTENTPLNLACMAVECYIAICVPLRHIQICTVKRTLMLIGLIWATSMLSVLPDLFITLATEPLDFFHSRVFCLRETVFPHPVHHQEERYHILSVSKMNESSANQTVVGRYPDSFSKAVTKNVIVVVIGISINYINASLIHTFSKNQIFYMNPRYILFIHLVINDMIQVTLSIILFLISYTVYKINVSICCIFILIALLTTENTPLNLACMAVECYIAICVPLRHIQICTVKRTLMLIGLIWATNMLSVLPDLFITLATEPLDFFHSRVFCLRETVFPGPVIVKKRDITYSVFLVIVWLTIFYTYFKILFTAKTASKDAKKARNTIILHGFQLLLCMATYVAPQLLDVVQQWFPKNYTDSLFAYYIIVQILPRSISPVIYGIRDNTFRKYLKKYLLCKVSTNRIVSKFDDGVGAVGGHAVMHVNREYSRGLSTQPWGAPVFRVRVEDVVLPIRTAWGLLMWERAVWRDEGDGIFS